MPHVSDEPVRMTQAVEHRRHFRGFDLDDVATAAADLTEGGHTGLYNVGSGKELTIKALADLIAEVVGYRGAIEWDAIRPDGTPRKLLDVGRLHHLGWRHRVTLRAGIESTYEWFLQSRDEQRRAAELVTTPAFS